MHTIALLLTRGIHYFLSCVIDCITLSIIDATPGDKLLYTSHARARVVHTIAKCALSTVVTRNDILLFITLFLCLHVRESLPVNGGNESSNRENCRAARSATRTHAGCPGDFFVSQCNIFENRIMINTLPRSYVPIILLFLT